MHRQLEVDRNQFRHLTVKGVVNQVVEKLLGGFAAFDDGALDLGHPEPFLATMHKAKRNPDTSSDAINALSAFDIALNFSSVPPEATISVTGVINVPRYVDAGLNPGAGDCMISTEDLAGRASDNTFLTHAPNGKRLKTLVFVVRVINFVEMLDDLGATEDGSPEKPFSLGVGEGDQEDEEDDDQEDEEEADEEAEEEAEEAAEEEAEEAAEVQGAGAAIEGEGEQEKTAAEERVPRVRAPSRKKAEEAAV